MDAMILAAGRGERLKPITDSIPKPLIRIGKRSLIEHHIVKLKAHGFDRLVINISHLGNQIEQTLGDGRKYGIEIIYSREPREPLETGGGIRQALQYINTEILLVVNGDIFTDFEFRKIEIDQGTNAHLVMVENPDHNIKGDFRLEKSQVELIESGNAHSFTFAGIGYYRRTLFEVQPLGRYPLLPLLKSEIQKNRVSGEVYRGLWVDVGTKERLQQARKIEKNIKHQYIKSKFK